MNSIIVHQYHDINFDNIHIPELNWEYRQPTSKISYLNVNQLEMPILIQTGIIKMTFYGIPHINDWRPKDDEREFIYIPLDPNQWQCIELRNHLEQIDAYFGSNEIKKKLFGRRAKEYEYSSCIRRILDFESDSDEEFKKQECRKPERCKMKFEMAQSGESRINITKLIKIVNGKKIPVSAKTITEIANNITFGTEIRLVFKYHKIWASKVKHLGCQFRQYGIGLKVVLIEFSPKKPNITNIKFISMNATFMEDNSDSIEEY
jgi:hypothetical protein